MSALRESGRRPGGLAAGGIAALRAIPPAAVAVGARAVVSAVVGAKADDARRFAERLRLAAGLPHVALFGDRR